MRTTGDVADVPCAASGWSLDAALKDPAVEEPINRWVHRRVAFSLIRPLEHLDLRVTPNQITLLSGVAGLAAAACYYHALRGGAVFALAGAILLFSSVIFDCADGMLARLGGGGSRLGMLLDGFVDTLVGVSVWYGVSHTLCGQIQLWWAWPVCVLMLPTILVHCALYDDAKNRFLGAVGPARRQAAPPASAVERALDGIYRTVYGGIASGTPRPRALERVDRARARDELQLPMRLMSFIGLGSHLVVIYTATVLSAFDPELALAAMAALILVGANAVMTAALVSWKRAWRRLEDA